jgi:uncharacterized protein DUF6599
VQGAPDPARRLRLNNPATKGSLVVSNQEEMRRYLCAFAVLLATSACSFAQAPLLPDRFATWQPSQHPTVVLWPRNSANASQAHPESEKLLTESGAVREEEHYYEKNNSELTVRAWKLKDASGAYEVYTSLLKPGQLPARVGQVAAFDKEGVVILLGNLVISSTANASRDDLSALVQAATASSGKAPLPPIPGYLPNQGRVPGSERYALGPVAFRSAAADLGRPEFAALADEVGFKLGAEAMFAEYQTRTQEAALLLIEYPTPQLAEQHLRHLETAISPAAKQAGTTLERKGSLLTLVLKPSSAPYAEALRSAVNYETEVTWNEPTHKMTDPPWLVIVGRIIIWTFMFMGLAVAVGAAFGGVRVLVKIFFPGKVFDRPGHMDVLQLGLSSKRIDSRDFY